MKQTGQIWTTQPSGLFVPSGTYSDSFYKSKGNFLEFKEHAEAIESLYAAQKIRLPNDSDLGLLIQNAKEIWTNFLLNKQSDNMIFKALHLARIADALLPLKSEKEQSQYLKDMLSGSLNFLARKQSLAKNMLWELELWSKIKKKLPQVYLQEPPDIVVNFDGSHIGIACKKIYSEKHIQNVLSQAVGQIEKEFDFGIVAINIDDLLPSDSILEANNQEVATECLLRHNVQFLEKHDRHFYKYLSNNRLISVIIFSAAIVELRNERPRFNNFWQWTEWSFPEIPDYYKTPLNQFYNAIMN